MHPGVHVLSPPSTARDPPPLPPRCAEEYAARQLVLTGPLLGPAATARHAGTPDGAGLWVRYYGPEASLLDDEDASAARMASVTHWVVADVTQKQVRGCGLRHWQGEAAEAGPAALSSFPPPAPLAKCPKAPPTTHHPTPPTTTTITTPCSGPGAGGGSAAAPQRRRPRRCGGECRRRGGAGGRPLFRPAAAYRAAGCGGGQRTL